MKQEKSIPWYRRVRRFGQTNLTEDDPGRNNIAFWREQWRRTKVQGLIINCGGIVAYYPSRYGLQYRAETLGEKDYFATWAKAAREEGLAVIARMDINRATEEFYLAHPDWFCVDREGKPYTSQGRYFSCVNSGYYKEYIPAVLTEICERCHPEGFADNSWSGMGMKEICYCRNCREKFEKDCRLPLPEKPDWDDPVYRAWVKWSFGCRTENWDLFNETVQKAGGPDCLWCGMLNADPAGSGWAFADKKALLSRSKIVFTDHQSRDILNGFEQNMDNGLLLHMASSEDVVIPESMANYVRGKHTFRLSANPAEETHTWMFSGAAGGISPWYHHIGGGTRDRRQFETPVEFMNWHAAHEDALYDRKTLANAAVVWSQENAVFYGRDEMRERVSYPYRGVLSALHENRIPFFPVHLDDVPKYRDRIETLILPDIEVMTAAQEEILLEWIKAGKHLILSGKPGVLDEYGELKGGKLHSRILSALGLKLTGGSKISQPSDWEHPSVHSYLSIHESRKPHETADGQSLDEYAEAEPEAALLRGFEETDILPFGGELLLVEREENAEEASLRGFGGFVHPFPIFPPEFAWIRETDETAHPFYAGVLPNGARIVYFAADIDRTAGRDRLPDHLDLIANAVRWTLQGKLPAEVEGPGFIDVSVWRQENGRRIVHLNNLSAADLSHLMRRRIPIGGVTLKLPAEGFHTASVRLLRSGREFTVNEEDSFFTIPIGEIDDFEAAVISAYFLNTTINFTPSAE